MDGTAYMLLFMLALSPLLAHEYQGYYAIAFALYCGLAGIAKVIKERE